MTKETSQNSGQAGTLAGSSTLVEETPLGLSAEQMQKSNPSAVSELQAKAKAEDRQRLSDLRAAFKEDPDFAMEAFEAGLSIDAAKAKRYDAIAPKVADLQKQVNDLQAAVDANKVAVTMTSQDGKQVDASGGDPLEAEAAKLWDGDQNLRNEFGGEKTAFLAGFKKNPALYRKK